MPKAKAKVLREIAEPLTRTVWVKCIVVDSDGTPVNEHGEITRKPWYSWEKMRRRTKWLNDPKNRKLWKELRREDAEIHS